MSKNKKKSGLGLDVKKEENFARWYQEILTKGECIEYYDISGCYILRPNSYFVWEEIRNYFDQRIRNMGVQNAYFPLFVSESALNKEKDHVEGFSAEVAWITESGKSKLAQRIAVRPTSETIMYPAYAKWIRSHRDLPLKLNQWSNVVRWEFKSPTPFLRSREFLWQEGHTAFATLEEASKEVYEILDLYASVYQDLLAVPVIKGRKTEEEKFPGGLYTTTVEAYIPVSGRGIQGATSHCLGQNFAKMFGIQYVKDPNQPAEYCWQNSWGLTTRSIGVALMVHSDNHGVVWPPRVAPIQAVIVPIQYKDQDNNGIMNNAKELFEILKKNGIRAHVDMSEGHNPGFKFAHWEVRGIPVRVELGPEDFEKKTCVLARRDLVDVKNSKQTVSQKDLASSVLTMLDQMQKALFEKASTSRDQHVRKVLEWSGFVPALQDKNLILAPHCDQTECELKIKKRSGEESIEFEKSQKFAKSVKSVNVPASLEKEEEGVEPLTGAAKILCKPLQQDPLPQDAKCIGCGAAAKTWSLFGRSY